MSVEELRSDLSELNLLLSKSTRTRVQNALSFEIRKIEAELMKSKEATSPLQEAPPSQIQSNKSSTPKNYEVKLQNYAWDQNDNLVKIFVTLPGVQDLAPESIIATNDERSMELKVLGLENKNYTLKIANLLYPITECSSRAKKDMVVVSLKKQASGKNWSHVTETDKRAADAKAPKKREGEDAVKDPSSGLMDMMKQMYEDGDDDMKRMIAKAWTEGKGNEKQMPTMPDFNNL